MKRPFPPAPAASDAEKNSFEKRAPPSFYRERNPFSRSGKRRGPKLFFESRNFTFRKGTQIHSLKNGNVRLSLFRENRKTAPTKGILSEVLKHIYVKLFSFPSSRFKNRAEGRNLFPHRKNNIPSIFFLRKAFMTKASSFLA